MTTNEALAYGLKGIQWFTTGLVFRQDGTLTESGADIQRINAGLNALGPILIRLRSTEVWHTAPIPDSANALRTDDRIATASGDLVIGAFVNDATGADYLLVVNSSIEKPEWVVISLDDIALAVELFDREVRQWSVMGVPDDTRHARVEFILQPGDGALLRLQ